MFSVQDTAAMLTKAGLPARIMIDASHANSRKVPARQIDVVNDIATQIARGNEDIFGIMIESNLEEGRQDVLDGQSLTYGQSITDACVAWRDTEPLLQALAAAVRQRRAGR
jgi:3-deoxy-7-phosphoheptulonate synthase